MVDLVSKLKLDSSEFSKGTVKATSDIIKFSDKATKSIDEIAKGFSKTETELTQLNDQTEASSQQQANSWGRVAVATAAVAVIAAGFFKSMVNASPSLSAAFAEINFMSEEMFMVLGERLAPLIEATLVPLFEALTNAVINLGPEMQTLIAYVIGLIVVLALANTLLAIFGLSLAILLGPIGLIILAIAALAIAYKMNFLGIRDGIDGFISYVGDAFGGLVEDHRNTFDVIIEIVQKAWDVILAIGEFAVEGIINILTFLVDVIVIIIDQFFDLLEGLFKIFKGIFTLDFKLILEGLEDMFRSTFENIVAIVTRVLDLIVDMIRTFGSFLSDLIDIIFGIDIGEKLGMFPEFLKSMINLIAGFINDFILAPIDRMLRSVSEKVDKIPTVSNPGWKLDYRLPMFHGGGIVPGAIGQEVNITALGGEIISNPMRGQTASDVIKRDGGRDGGGNSVFNFTFNNTQLPDRASRNSLVNEAETKFRRTLALYPSGR